MSALSPWFLAAAVAIAVPIFLHLFQRQQARRVSFPALRYLERTEREHARRIRLSQLLLLMARVAILLLLVGAGARLVLLGRGGSHPATAVVIVLDNSVSSGLVVGEERMLDRLKTIARRTLDAGSDEDRFWLVRAGEPWVPALPGSAREASVAVEETEPSAARGDLTAALERAVELLATAELDRREIHLLSDLQATAFEVPGGAPAQGLPVVVWVPADAPAANRALTGVLVGGGIPPLQGQRAEITVSTLESEDTTRTPVRVVIGERIRGAASLAPGAETAISLPASGAGWVQGYADADPDALRADDRRFFAYRSRPAPQVAVSGVPGLFTSEALAVLADGGRISPSPPRMASLLVSPNGSGLDERGPRTASLVVPDADAALLPALNRRLVEAGIPWRLEARTSSGETDLVGNELPGPLQGVRARDWFELVLAGDPPGATRTLAEVVGGPWAVEGTDAEGRRYLLVASPFDAEATSLPVSTGMLRFFDWAANEWSGSAGGSVEYLAGDRLAAPATATHVRDPSGAVFEIDGTRTVRRTGEAGFYTFLAADTAVGVMAVNPPQAESSLAFLDPDEFDAAIGPEAVAVSGDGAWSRAIYRARQGPELWWPFLLAAAVLLALESLMAASGRGVSTRSKTTAIADAVS
jgi:hypothetical protein